jgi:hypothetical protein
LTNMTRYYFDFVENDTTARDDVGLCLPNTQAAEMEAAKSLADMVKDLPPDAERSSISVEVRTENGPPLFRAAIIYEIKPRLS